MLIRALAIIGTLAAAPAALACDIALVLAVDVSGSVDPDEYTIQMQGLATALDDSSVAEALVNAKAKIMVLQWTGSGRQRISIPWRTLETHAAAAQLSADVAVIPREWRSFSTAIGDALEVALAAFALPEAVDCARHVIDVSGDGPSNEGALPENVRQIAALRGVTINALVIEETVPDLTAYFEQYVITGPGAFAVTAETFEDYPDRIKQKLLREVVMQLAVVK